MANGEEGNDQGQNENRDLEQELKAAQQKLETAEEGLSRIRTERDEAVERKKIAENDAEQARNLEESAKKGAKKARTDRNAASKREAEAIRRERVAVQRAKDAENKANRAKEREKAANEALNEQALADKLFEDAKAARRGLRDFVRDALTDIMLGVDDAATHAGSRKLTDGLSESGLISPSSIGDRPGTNRESLVEFDLAVMAGEQHTDKFEKDSGANLKLSLMNVLPLGISGQAGWHRKKTSEDRSEVSHHNRIRFSVPVVFARGDDSLE